MSKSRPAPEVIRQHIDRKNKQTTTITGDIGLWVVLHRGLPFNLIKEAQTKKYSRTSFNNPGSANLLCRKMNLLFNTTDFTVEKVK